MENSDGGDDFLVLSPRFSVQNRRATRARSTLKRELKTTAKKHAKAWTQNFFFMKAFFYFRMNLDTPEHIGVRKKVRQILRAFNELGVETDVAQFTNCGLELNGELLKEFSANKLKRGWENNAEVHKTLLEKVNFSKYDFAWMRVGLVLPWVFQFIKNAKKRNPKMKIFLEYGTYPFDMELEGFVKKLYPVSEFYLKRLKNHVEKIITFCGQDEIHGIDCIKMSNGIDVGEYKWNEKPPEFTDTLNLIAVSSLHKWHAYDRVINGMKNYYTEDFDRLKININFHIVGEGEEKQNLEIMSKEFNLQDKIFFHGYQTGNDLDEFFEKCHLAIGTLGMHRININVVSSLKNREYCARAIPFVLATSDSDFPENLPFVKYVSGDDSDISIGNLLNFYRLFKTVETNSAIRNYAEKNLVWKQKIAEILD